MNFINTNIIKFHGKSRKGSNNVEIREQILTLQNLYQTYRKNLILLSEQQEIQNTEGLELLQKNLHIIEEQIGKLTGLIR